MAIGLYDQAVVKKLQSWMPEASDIQILSPDETDQLFITKSDQAKDKPLKLPLIALSRKSDINFLNVLKQPKSFEGVVFKKYRDDTGELVKTDKAIKLTAIPMQLDYQLDIYTKKRSEADNYLREFIFKFVNKPKVMIEIPYRGVNIKHESTIYLDNTVQDNSNIPQRQFPGQFTRYTITFSIDNAYIFSVPELPNLSVDLGEIEIDSINNGNIIVEAVEEIDLD